MLPQSTMGVSLYLCFAHKRNKRDSHKMSYRHRLTQIDDKSKKYSKVIATEDTEGKYSVLSGPLWQKLHFNYTLYTINNAKLKFINSDFVVSIEHNKHVY